MTFLITPRVALNVGDFSVDEVHVTITEHKVMRSERRESNVDGR
ncbi:MAG TPA: hypothetical protein VII65_02970 [Acidimicrobiales bacterium]